MEPQDYYNHFQEDLRVLMGKVTVGGDGHFHIVELFFDHSQKQQDKLASIPKDRLAYFLSALSCTILIDQVMYAHFDRDYADFRSMTLYPKVTWSIGWCANVKPWQLFEHRIALSRGLKNPEKATKFTEFADFFVQDIKEFFLEGKFIEANWEKIKAVMLGDADIVSTKYGDGDYGELFRKILEKY